MDPEGGAVQQFAAELRELRHGADGLTYRQLADRSGFAVTTLSEAAGGRRLPTLDVALAYAMACGGDEQEWTAKWRAAAVTVAESRYERRPEGRDKPPYRGLHGFRTADADLFFGRERLVSDVVARVSARAVTVICGPSGAGRSSFLAAGVVPALRQSLRPVVVTPGEVPPADLLAGLPSGETPVLVVVDQFELVYTRYDAREREEFIDGILTRAAHPDGRFRLVLSVRADFSARLAEHPGLSEAVRDDPVLVGPMQEQDLSAAVVKPALAVGLSVERALLVTVVNEAGGQAGALPLLSHALLETWRRRRGDVLTLAGFTAAGGIGAAVAQTAETAYRELGPASQRLAAGLLLRMLAVDEETGAVTRRRLDLAELREIAPGAEEVIDHLAGARLVVVDHDTAEIAHGCVLTAWQRMRSWIDEHHDALRAHRTITEAARAWAGGRDPSAVATGARLESMCSYAVSGSAPFGLSPLERAFIEESVAQTRRAGAAARRRTGRLRVVTAVAVVWALIAGVLAVVASNARTEALAARDNALSRQTALTAAKLRATDPGLAAQLAIAAYRIAQTGEARSELLERSSAPVPARHLGGAGATALAASPDGDLVVVSDATDGSVRLLTRTGAGLAKAGVITPRHQDGADAKDATVYALALSADSRTLVIGDMKSSITMWDVTDRSDPRRLAVPIAAGVGPIERLDIDPTGRQLAAAGGDRILRWNIEDPANPRALTPLPAPAKTKTVVHGGAGLLAFGTEAGRVHLWQTNGNGSGPDGAAELAVLEAGTRGVPAVSFSPDGKVLVAGSFDRALRSWDISAPREPRALRSLTDLAGNKITTTAFSPDGAHLVVGSADSTLHVLDTATWTTVEVLNHPDVVTWALFTDDGRSIVSVTTDGAARVWKLTTALPPRSGTPVFDTRFNGDGTRLAVFAEGGFTLWDTSDPTARAPLTGTITGEGAVFSGAGDLSGDLVAAGTAGGEVHLLDVSDPRRPRPRARLGGSQEEVTAVAFNPGRSRLAAAGRDSSIRIWDVTGEQPRLITVFDAPREVVLDLDWNPAGTLLAAASADRGVYLFDLSGTPSPRARLEGLDSYVYSTEFGPSGNVLAAGGVDGVVILWDVTDPAAPVRLGQPLRGPAGRIQDLGFHPEKDLLAASVIDGSTWLWTVSDPAHPVRTAVLSATSSPLNTAVFRPTGDLLVAGGGDGRLRSWRTDEEAVISAICAGVGDPITEREWRAHLPDVPYAPPCPRV
ncbi:hypothetical protein GCM10017774_39730 [Lentzea cavernae]|uniref:HTH cro/C1-type domain-containing protein n=1 Tax=Lentzea cavernae TaxID=2020703 RepID=A0ABQ3MLP8_9PSEU|nr:hypothetical protein GCM10017774_39730 [Lentzea cavernae]